MQTHAFQTLAFRTCGSPAAPYIVLLHTAEAPRSEEWGEYAKAVQAAVSQAEQRLIAFVATDGGSPNAGQRRLLADIVVKGVGAETHVFTTDLLIRSVVTAFSWIAKPGAAAHAPRDFGAVCNACGFSPQDVLREFAIAQQAFPRVFVLQRVIESMAAR